MKEKENYLFNYINFTDIYSGTKTELLNFSYRPNCQSNPICAIKLKIITFNINGEK